MVSVVRCARDHRRHRPPGQHRDLGAEHLVAHLLHARDFALDAGEALHQRDVPERVGGALGDVGVVALDRCFAAVSLLLTTSAISTANTAAQHDQQQAVAPVDEKRQRHQHDERDEAGEVLAEKGEPQSPQRIRPGHHHLHQPPGMRAGVVAQRELQHVLEEHRAHHLVLAVGQPIGVERDERAADDGEQARSRPRRRPAASGPARAVPRRGPGRSPAYRRCARTGSVPRTSRRRAPGWRAPGSSPDGPRARAARARGCRDEGIS